MRWGGKILGKPDMWENTLKYSLHKVSCVCGITKANYGSLQFEILYLLIRVFLVPSEVIKCFVSKHTKSEKLHNNLSVIKNY
jgi:hypothetical protein